MQKPFFKFTEAVNDNGTVWYTIQVHAKGSDPQPIIIKQRYSQLRQIHKKCSQTQYKNDLPDFPQKKLFGATNQDFIQKRKKELQNYYNTLSKTIDIQKLPELNKFIESHRKKKVQIKQSKLKNDDGHKLQTQFKQQQHLKKAFENIYKDVLSQFIDLSKDFYPMAEMSHDDSGKKFSVEIINAKPGQSVLLSEAKVQGIQDNETDYWSMFLKDEHQDFINKSVKILAECNQLEKQIISQHKESIVVVK